MEELIGKNFGPYEIQKLIGKGGMAAVYLAHQPSMNRGVAIKVMFEQFAGQGAFIERFKNEARLIANLEHAHILPVFDFGEQDGTLYIVMRYLPTGTLEERIKKGLPLEETVRLFGQIASALDYAHQRGVVHRDLKPGNVMIDSQENTFLTDFGIAKMLNSDAKLTRTDSVVGTPTYMSPEQGLGEPLDGRSDVYALGILLFEMLTGRVPFTAENPMAVLLKHINDPLPSLTAFNPDIPPEVEQVVHKATSKSAADRYQTANEMARALREAYDISTGRVPRPAKPAPAALDTMPLDTPATAVLEAIGQQTTLGSPLGENAATVAAPPGMISGAPMPTAAAPAIIPDVNLAFNPISKWVHTQSALGDWLEAGALSIVTFVLLSFLTQGALIEIGLLSLLPGVVIYGLLRAPTVGGLFSMALILVPLMVHAPGLALLWAALTILAGARLTAREMLLTLTGIVLAGTPLGWLLPLAAPWWFKVRSVVLPAALGVLFATIFSATLGWPAAGGLLDASEAAVTLSPFDTTYVGLFDPALWAGWSQVDQLVGSIADTYALLGQLLVITGGLPLIMAAAWAVAAVLSVSNRKAQEVYLRPVGLLLGLLALIGPYYLFGGEGSQPPAPLALGLGVGAAVLAGLLTQWPLQADPDGGNQLGTTLRLLRQSLGALYLSAGLAFAITGLGLDASPWFLWAWLLAGFGILATLVDPLTGPPVVFAGLVIGLAPLNPTLTAVLGALLALYLIVTFFFDRRRPRRWNPLGAGIIVGAPGLAGAGMLPLAVMSIGALEAQVPAAVLAAAGHVTLIAASGQPFNPLGSLVQVLVTVAGVLVIERLMSLDVLDELPHKLRRLIFTVAMGPLLAIGYYLVAGIALDIALWQAFVLVILQSAMLVAAMGERSAFWRRFIERQEEEEEILEDEEVTDQTARRRSRTAAPRSA